MQIITFANIKGGSGKTTCAIHACYLLARENKKVLLVDADKQSSAMDFRSIRNQHKDLIQFPSVQNVSKSIGDDIKEFTGFDNVVIDVGAKNDDVLRAAIVCADVIVSPVIPSSLDLWGAQQTFELIAQAKSFNKSLQAFSFLNMVRHNKLSTEIVNLMLQLESEYEITFLESKLFDRVTYKYCVGDGKSIFELGSKRDNKAINEFTNLYDELEKRITSHDKNSVKT